MGVLRRSLVTVLMLLVAGAFNPVMASGKYFNFGINPVDPTRQETLKPGQCVIALAADSSVPVTVKARYDKSGEFQTDTAHIHAGEEIVVNSNGVALYVAYCGNDILAPNDWTPEGTTIRCEPGNEESLDSEIAVAIVAEAPFTDTLAGEIGEGDEPIFVPISGSETQSKKKKKWLWILAGLAGGVLVGTAFTGDDNDSIHSQL